MATPSYLAGKNWLPLISDCSYYGYGFKWLYAVFFKLTDKAEVIFRCIQITQIFMIALCATILYHAVKKYLCGGKDNPPAYLILLLGNGFSSITYNSEGSLYFFSFKCIKNFSDALGDTYDIRIVCCNHDLNDPTPYVGISEGWNQVGKAKVCYLADSDMNFDKLSNLMAEEKPDLIYGSGIMYYKVNSIIFKAAKANSIPVLLAPRGDLGTNALKVKAWKKKPFLADMSSNEYKKLSVGACEFFDRQVDREQLKKQYIEILDKISC